MLNHPFPWRCGEMRLKVSNVCQLINKAKIDATKTVYGVTFTNDGSGVVVANGGPSTGQGAFYVDRAVVIDPTHIYLNPKSADIPGTCALGCDLYGDSGYIPGSENGFDRDVPFKFNSQGKTAVFYYVIFANKTVTNLRLIPQLFDLTEMYGAGNEPTTVAQFRQDFPNEMYEYSPECWKKFRRLKYVTDKYGSIDLGTLAWTYNLVSGQYYSPSISEAKPNGKIFCNKYQNVTNSFGTDKNIFIGLNGNFGIQDSSFVADPVGFKQSLSGVIASFELKPDTTYENPGYLPLNRGKYIANKEPVQLLDKSKFYATSTDHGVTFTNNGDGTITVNGTNNGEIYYNLEVLTSIPVGHKVIIDDRNSTLYFFGDMRDSANVLLGTIPPRTIFTLPDNLARLNMLYFVRYNTGGVTYNNELSKPQLFDLTAMYGKGNEPTTVAQFRADYPNELYDYNPYNAITFR